MKKLLVGCLLVIMAGATGYANDLNVIFQDSIVAADTGDVRTDTVYSNVMDIRGYQRLGFYSRLTPYAPLADLDTNWADDSFLVYFQSSANKIAWNSFAIDTFLTTDSGWSWLLLNAESTFVGNYGRVMMIHWDSIGVGEAGAGQVDSFPNWYKNLEVWVTPKGGFWR